MGHYLTAGVHVVWVADPEEKSVVKLAIAMALKDANSFAKLALVGPVLSGRFTITRMRKNHLKNLRFQCAIAKMDGDFFGKFLPSSLDQRSGSAVMKCSCENRLLLAHL